MDSLFGHRRVTRRNVLRFGVIVAGVSAVPLLQACAGGAATPTVAPTAAPAESAAATPTAPAAANATAAPSSQTAPAAGVNPASVKINGQLSVLQERDYNPIHNDNIHNEVQKFAQTNNWNLDLSYMEAFVGGGDFYQKIAAAVTSGDSPDMMFGTKDAFLLQYNKLAQPVDDVVAWASSNYGDPIPGIKFANVIDGKWYGVPFFTRVGGNWARKSWFDAVSFDITTSHSLQEWLDAAVKVSDSSKKRWGWGRTVNRSGDGQTNVYEPVFGAGGRYTDSSGQKVVFNSDETVAGFQWLKDVYGSASKYKAALPPGVDGWNDTSNNQALLAGTIGFTSNAGTLFAQAVKQEPDLAKDIFLVPPPTDPIHAKGTYASSGGATFTIFQGAKNPDASKAMIEHILGKDIQKQIWSTSSGYACPAYKWGWDEPEVTGSINNVDKIFQKLVYGDQTFIWSPGPGPRLWIQAADQAVIMTETIAAILKGTAVKDAVAASHKKLQDLLDKYQGK